MVLICLFCSPRMILGECVTGLDIIPQYVVLDSDYLFLSLFLLLLFWVFARL